MIDKEKRKKQTKAYNQAHPDMIRAARERYLQSEKGKAAQKVQRAKATERWKEIYRLCREMTGLSHAQFMKLPDDRRQLYYGIARDAMKTTGRW